MRKIPTKLDLFDNVHSLVDVAAIAYFALLSPDIRKEIGGIITYSDEELLAILEELENFFSKDKEII